MCFHGNPHTLKLNMPPPLFICCHPRGKLDMTISDGISKFVFLPKMLFDTAVIKTSLTEASIAETEIDICILQLKYTLNEQQ